MSIAILIAVPIISTVICHVLAKKTSQDQSSLTPLIFAKVKSAKEANRH